VITAKIAGLEHLSSSISLQKMFHIDNEHHFPDQLQEKKEEGRRWGWWV